MTSNNNNNNNHDDCIFCKIINKTIPSKLIYEDELIMAFYDLYPKSKVHFLIIPKRHIESMLMLNNNISQDLNIDKHNEDLQLMGYMVMQANQIAKNILNLSGYKLHVNTGKTGGQEVFHLHIHILA